MSFQGHSENPYVSTRCRGERGLLASILGEWPVGALPPCSSDGALILRVDGCGNRLAVNFIGGNVSYVSTSEVTRIVGREADQGTPTTKTNSIFGDPRPFFVSAPVVLALDGPDTLAC